MAAYDPDPRTRRDARPSGDQAPDSASPDVTPTPMREGSRRAAVLTLAVLAVVIVVVLIVVV